MSVADEVEKLERRVESLEGEVERLRERAESAEADAENFERMWSRAQARVDRFESDEGRVDRFESDEGTAIAKPFRPDVKRIDAGDWTHAMSQCVCEVCGYQFWEHPTVPGYMWMHRICDGRLVKL